MSIVVIVAAIFLTLQIGCLVTQIILGAHKRTEDALAWGRACLVFGVLCQLALCARLFL